MKNILIVTSSFWPKNSPRSFRATELAKELSRQGNMVTVLTERLDVHLEFEREYNLTVRDFGKISWKGSNSSEIRLFRPLLNIFFRLLLLFLEFPRVEIFFRVKNALKVLSGFDLLISIAAPHTTHWGVAFALNSSLTKVWVADNGDPYMFKENDRFRPPFYFSWIEKWYCKKADFLTVPTSTSYKGFYPEFHNKIRVIPQGFRFEDISTDPLHSHSNKVIFGYGGGFIPGFRDPREFLKFLSDLDFSFDYEFHIFTPHRHLIAPFAALDSRILVHDPIPRLELLRIFSSYDFVVNFSNQGDVQTPSKLIDYSIIEKPILDIKSCAFDKGLVLQFLEKNYSQSLVVSNIDKYRIENVAAQFLILCTK